MLPAHPTRLIGRHARVSANLRPTGKIVLDGTRYDARAEGWIEAGATVVIAGVEAGAFRVRPQAEGPAPAATKPSRGKPAKAPPATPVPVWEALLVDWFGPVVIPGLLWALTGSWVVAAVAAGVVLTIQIAA